MKTNIPMEQAFVGATSTKRTTPTPTKNGTPQKVPAMVEWGSDQGPMLTTSEILDFAAGTDSTP